MADSKLPNESGEENENNPDETSRVYGSLSPESMASLDPSEIVDYTGTIGTAPGEFGSGLVEDMPAIGGDDEFAQTRMVDDDFYQQVQTFFPTDSGSQSAGSASAKKEERRDPQADYSQSVSMREDRSNLSIDDFIPPVREIKFPSDTASLDQIRELDPETIEGDEYHITEKLGEGGYGIVFEADQMALNRPVAIKVLKPKKRKGSQSKGPSQSGTGTGELQRRRDQFLHEAKITARLQHPNIVPLYDFGINATGQLFYSMKKVERRPWSSILHRPDRLLGIASSEVDELAERQAISRNIEIFSRVCDGMAYAHSMKVVHRDLKPDNIMIGSFGEVLLIDFGMALDLSEKGSRDFSAGGTLVYMSPEMAQHFSKQKEIQIAAHKTAQVLGVDKGTIFLDQSNIVGVGSLAQRLIKESQDQGVIELAESLIRLDAEEKQLAKQISYSSDIYLLGAILYQIAVGHPPHYFPLSLCKKGQREKFQNELWLALRNGFQKYNKIDDPLRISLREIAIRAMRTDPADRFQTVEELQIAIRGFQKQVQSLELTESGKEELEKAKGREDYQHLLPALESFRGASELWPEGSEANQMRRTAACEYAKRATKRRDYDAGLSILDEYVLEENQSDQPVVEVRQNLEKGKKRAARNRKLAVLSSVAAVVLPAAAFFGFLFFTSKLRQESSSLKEERVALKDELKQIQPELEEARTAVANAKEDAKQEVLKIREANELEIARINKESERTLETARIKNKAEMESAKKENDLAMERAKRENEKAMQEATAQNETAMRVAKQKNSEAIAKEIARAEQAKAKADEYQLLADLGEYSANILTIPLDFRTSKLSEANAKIEALMISDAKPQFKNGWLVKHFAKQLESGKTIQDMGNASSITDIVNIPSSTDTLAIGKEDGEIAVWKIDANDVSSKVPVSISQAGELADASVSSDGKFLGLAFGNAEDKETGANIVVVDIDSENVIPMPEENIKQLVACKHLQFSNSDANRLVAVEEIKGFYDLKQRVHVVEYRVDGRKLSEVSREKVDATNRTEEPVSDGYVASIHWENGKPVTAVAYDSLDKGRREIQKLEVVSGSEHYRMKDPLNRFPTALLMGSKGKLYSGYRDGSVEVFSANNLDQRSTRLDNLNENEISVLAESEDGSLLAGSKNGQIVIWGPDRRSSSKIDGQEGQLTSIAITNEGRILSGGDTGSISVWKPGGEYFDPAEIRTKSLVTVTCGTIDQGIDAGTVPATAYGTQSGEVAYFNSEAMKESREGQIIKEPNSNEVSATFRFKSPFASFDNAFDDFDSMGIINDWFVVMKNDGTLVTTLIDETESRRDVASSKMDSTPFPGEVMSGYIPLMGSVHNRDYFYTNDPSKEENLLLWRRNGSRFTDTPVVSANQSKGQIKRLVMSPDGRWLAVVRLADRKGGKYRTEVLDVSGGRQQVSAAKTSELYRVGDPAFVGFSENSDELIFHGHSYTDRKTLVETWDLAGSQWTQRSLRPQVVAKQKVDLIDWSNAGDVDELVTRFNRNYFLRSTSLEAEPTPVKKEVDEDERPERLRNVLSAGSQKQYYVLTASSLAKYDAEKQESTDAYVPQNARDMRVYGERVVVLDQKGFHLFDSDLKYVTKLASRKAAVEAVSLSGQKLAICYDNQLCRIWNVGGEKPEAIGKVDDTAMVQLSPDGKWAACLVGGKIQIFDVGSQFDAPKSILPESGAFRWSGKKDSTLIVATSRDDGTDWSEIDPVTGGSVARTDLPKEIGGIKDFNLAPLTENFIAIQGADGISLWATGAEPERMTKEAHEFDAAPLVDLKSITFSEIAQAKPEDIGTRMAILAGDGNEPEPVARIYLLAKQLQESTEAGEAGEATYRYRVVEIEGALESNRIEKFDGGSQAEVSNALELKSLQFSGDGKSLLKVHKLGTSTLLTD
jgi:serine/threonine protein kinase/WD40 repeat protein